MEYLDLFIKDELKAANLIKEEMEVKSGKKMMDLIQNEDKEIEELKNDFCKKVFDLISKTVIYLVGSDSKYHKQLYSYYEKIGNGWQTRYEDGDYTKSYKHCLNAFYYILKHFSNYQ